MTTEQYQQASEHFLAQARRELADGDLPRHLRRAGAPPPRFSRQSRRSGDGNIAGTGTTTESSAGSGRKQATATSVVFSPLPACSTRIFTKTDGGR